MAKNVKVDVEGRRIMLPCMNLLGLSFDDLNTENLDVIVQAFEDVYQAGLTRGAAAVGKAAGKAEDEIRRGVRP